MRSALPGPLLKDTLPPVPTGTTTRLGIVLPAAQWRLDASGSEDPVGNTVRKPAVVVLVTVAFSTTALTPVAGMPPTPVTWTSRVEPAVSVDPALGWPLPGRVSVMRPGKTGA